MATRPKSVDSDVANLRAAVGAARKEHRQSLGRDWNLRAFGGLSATWNAGKDDSPKRDWHSVALIAEIIRHFDVIAVREVRRETTALRFLLDCLGESWHVIVSDVTKGAAGKGERLSFIYDASRI